MHEKNTTEKKMNYAKMGVSIFLVGALIWFIGVDSFLTAVRLIPLPIFIVLILLALVTLILNTLAVWVLYRTVSPISLALFLPAFLSSWVAGFFLPGKVGSLSITLLLKDTVKPGVSAAIFVLDKLITILLAITIGAFFLWQFLDPTLWALPLLVIIVGFAGVSFLFLTGAGRTIIRTIFGSRSAFFEGFSTSLPQFISNPRGIILNALLTLARSGVQAVSLVFVFTAFGFPISWGNTFALTSIENLSSLIPITLSGIGLREIVLGTLVSQLGIPFSLGATAGLVMTVVMLIIVIPGIFAFDEKKLFAHFKK